MVGQPVHAAARRLRAGDADDARCARSSRRCGPRSTELVAAAPEVDASFLQGDFPPDAQRAFAERVLATLGFEEGAWRLDPTAHPFCTSFSNRDVRLTTRYRPDDLESIWSTMHEAGHGLYAHGIADSAAPLHPRTARRRSGSTSRRAAPGRTSSAAAGRSGSTGTSRSRRRSRVARRRRARRLRARDQPRRARADPGRRGRDDLQPPHHPAVRARAGDDRGDGRARGPARGRGTRG